MFKRGIPKTRIFAAAIVLGIVVLKLFIPDSEQTRVEKYLEKKYEIKFASIEKHEPAPGSSEYPYYRVQFSDESKIFFKVLMNEGLFYDTVWGDTYEEDLDRYHIFKKIQPHLSEFKSIGFDVPSDWESVYSNTNIDGIEVYRLNVEGSVSFKSMNSLELDRLLSLVNLVKKYSDKIDEIGIFDNQNEFYKDVNIENISEINTKEQLLTAIKETSYGYWTPQLYDMIKDKDIFIKNNRLAIDMIACSKIDNMNCTEYSVDIRAEEGALNTKTNPYLVDDLIEIKQYLESKINMQISYIFGVDENDENYISLEKNDLRSRESIAASIEFAESIH